MRHPTHDYAGTGAYFVTICAHQRHPLFEDPVVSQVICTAWEEIPRHFPNASLDAFVVMPNHMHGIIALTGAVTRELRIQGLWDERPFWQRNFYDRVARDEGELTRIREYIADNPAAWLHDQENPSCVPNEGHVDRWGWLENADP